MNAIDIEKIKQWKAHADFYKEMINQFYSNALKCADVDEDKFYDYFYNDTVTLEEAIQGESVDDCMLCLKLEEEHVDGSGTYSFEYTQDFLNLVKEKTGNPSPTDKELSDYILDILD